MIWRYLGILLIYLLIINAVLMSNFITVNRTVHNSISDTIKSIILEYEELDLQHLCVATNCKNIGILDKASYIFTDEILRKEISYNKPEPLIKGTTLTKELDTIIHILDYGMFTTISTKELYLEIIKGYTYINILFLIIYTGVFIFLEIKKHRRKILDNATTSNRLQEKNMQILTENIHHELNTPVAIIQGNIRKLEIEMMESPGCRACDDQLIFDFGQVYSAVEQIDTVLQRMSNFKHLRYSNGNKDLSDILKYSANSMSIYKNANFNIEIDPKFEDYQLTGTLKNGDLLNIVSNHFRNSIEAHATKIVTQLKFDNIKQKIHLYVTDNGTGLRNPKTGLLLPQSEYNNIFKSYYSTKDELGDSRLTDSKGFVKDSYVKITSTMKSLAFKQPKVHNVRGIGLYLNKQLLNNNNGDLKLRETTIRGTVFEIIFPAKIKYR